MIEHQIIFMYGRRKIMKKKNKTQKVYFFFNIFKVSRIGCPDSRLWWDQWILGAMIKARNTASWFWRRLLHARLWHEGPEVPPQPLYPMAYPAEEIFRSNPMCHHGGAQRNTWALGPRPRLLFLVHTAVVNVCGGYGGPLGNKGQPPSLFPKK